MTNVQPPAEPSQIQTVNAVIQDQQVVSLVALIFNLTTTVQALQQRVNDGGRGNRDGRGGRGAHIFGPHLRWNGTNTRFYYYSRRLCNHTDDRCTNRYPGH